MLGRGGRRNQGGGGGGGGPFLEVSEDLGDLNNPEDARLNLGFTENDAGLVLFGDGSTTMASDSLFFFDVTRKALAINLAAPGAGAQLDVGGIVGGIGFPVVTTAERDLIAPARNGVMLYNSTTHTFSGFQNGAWVNLGDHGSLAGLGDDDHTQYALLAGRTLGQTLKGGTAAGENLNLQSTNHATKGQIIFGTASNYDQANDAMRLSGAVNFGATEGSLYVKAKSDSLGAQIQLTSANAASALYLNLRNNGDFFIYSPSGGNTYAGWSSSGFMWVGPVAGSQQLEVNRANSATTITTEQNSAAVMIRNNENTVPSNFSALYFGSAAKYTSAVIGRHDSHTGGVESGSLHFLVRDGGAASERLGIAKDGILTASAYGAGLSLFSSAGVISSLAAGAAGQVLYSNGTTWVASQRKEKAGVVDIAVGAMTKAIVFATARADALYTPLFFLKNSDDDDPIGIPVRLIAISALGFTFEWDDMLPTANYKGYWGILEHYDL